MSRCGGLSLSLWALISREAAGTLEGASPLPADSGTSLNQGLSYTERPHCVELANRDRSRETTRGLERGVEPSRRLFFPVAITVGGCIWCGGRSRGQPLAKSRGDIEEQCRLRRAGRTADYRRPLDIWIYFFDIARRLGDL